MRVTLIPIITVLAFSGVALATESLGQEALERKISLEARNQEISGLLTRIEEAANIRFIYSPEVIPVRQKVSLKADNDALGDVLKKLLAPYRITFEAVENQVVLRKQEAPAQTAGTPDQADAAAHTITGKVVDENGMGLPGVSVLIKGTTVGTVTDANGIYTLNVSNENEGGVLVISFIGYATQEILIDNRETIDIQMEPDVQSLQEVVVVGVSLKEKDLTGAVVNVDEKVLRERPVTNINEALQGKAAGVYIQNNPEPGQNASIRVRGNNSMQYGAAPLYVVDGVMMERDFNMLNVNDVASITVLKDASSTALYGSRGANGVILVTTKKGKSGEGKVTYDGWYGVSTLRNKDLTLGTKDVFDLRAEAMWNSSVGEAFRAANPGATRADLIQRGTIGSGGDEPKPIFADYERAAYAAGQNYNWLDAVTRSAVQQNHSLSFSGGTDKGSYYFSLGYADQQGTMLGSGYKRYTGRINLDQNLKKWLKVGTNTTLTRGEEKLVDGKVFGVARGANPMLPLDTDSLYLAWGNYWDVNQENPLKTLTIQKDRTKNRVISANYISITPVKHITVRSTYTVDYTDQQYYDYTPSNIQQSKRGGYRGRAAHNFDHIMNWQWDNSVNYENQFGKSNVQAFASFNLNKNDYFYTNLAVRDFPIDGFGYYNLGAATDKENVEYKSAFIDPYALMSYVGRVNYEYDGRYMVTATVRRDGSSRFADGNRWGTFPSVALGWNITNESFMSGQTLLNMAKLRVGYGSVGNQGIPSFAPYSLYDANYSNNAVSFVPSDQFGTRNVTWEKQKQLNIGIDLATWGNRLQFTAEYFNINNSNLLIKRTLSQVTTGFNYAYENVGEMTNKGLEFSVNALVVDAGDFKWNLSANLSKDKNKVTQLFGKADAIYNYGGFTNTEIQRDGNYFLGQSVNTLYLYEFDRIIQASDMDYVESLDISGKDLQPGDILPKDRTGDGKITQADRVVVGKKDPKFYGGFTSTFSWKGISLNAIFTYSYGAKRVSPLYESLMSGTGMSAMHKDELDRWTPEHTNTNIPRLTYDQSAHFGAGETSWAVQNASFLRLSTITLAYDLPAALMSRAGLSNVRIYATGTNLGLWTKYKGYDPENMDVWGNLDAYPTSKMMVVGLNLGF